MDSESETPKPFGPRANAFKTLLGKIYFHRLPSYGNKIFYGLGFLALTCLVLLAATGITMAFMGQSWWLANPLGIFVRSIHLWTVQAFIAILILHILVGLTTSGFRKPRRMVWVFGAIIFGLVLIQTEFGYGLRGDFSSQFRAVSGADFWNGSHLGYWLNPLNYNQTFALHVAIIPLLILLLFIAHYILEHSYGIARPYRPDIKYKMVPADHAVMYRRGVALVAAILVLAFFFPSPYVRAIRIADVTQQNPSMVAANLFQEFNRTSETATYLDSIDPYTFDTRYVYVVIPYQKLASSVGGENAWQAFERAPTNTQHQYTQQAQQYFAQPSAKSVALPNITNGVANPVITMINTLIPAAKNGLYAAILNQEQPSINDTYTLRFLNDMNLFERKAETLNMDTAQWGMTKDETGSIWKLPPGSWWLLPLGIVNSSFNLLSNPYGDRDAAWGLGALMLLFITFPYIPFLNRLPEKLNLAPFIWKTKEKKE
ncbi:MAG: hypothetical protein B7X04_00680 [Parcubacteria group bacterium 21-54-25]|nr:MAG: hypothetical protein B7X04_00680 [Parcubacteria group bacterium 21-54-25]HQU07975.1 cytochrome b N-terminal domain-containing protein [Candidatus Paceibacterota bacterium]